MAHGYLGDGYGKYGDRDPDGGSDDGRRDWRDARSDRDWRSGQQGEWRDRRYERGERDSGDRDRGDRFMFEGRDRDRDHWDSDREHGQQSEGGRQGFFARAADDAREWFGGDDRNDQSRNQDRGGGSSGGDRYSSRQPSAQGRYSSQDDHYLNWRQQQIDALDRDYRDYCSERQQQFHSDFDSWRSNRQQGSAGSQQSGWQQSGQNSELELTARHDMSGTSGTGTDPASEPQSTVEPDSTATLGTTNSENSNTAIRRR